MAKQLSFSNESREALEKGVNFVANAVKVTIGPKAKNVVIEKKIWFARYSKRWIYSC